MACFRADHLEESLLLAGLVIVQVVYGVNGVFTGNLMATGFHPLFLVAGVNLVASVLLFPIALYLEKKKWPKEISVLTLAQLLLIAAGGVTIFQTLMLLGIRNTSPAVASAMPNLAPGIIFALACCLGLEKVNLKCKHTKIKIAGTLICLAGAFTISFTQVSGAPTLKSHSAGDKNGFMGSMYLLIAVFALSCTVILQAITLQKLPAPLTLCTVTSFIGSILTWVLEIISSGGLQMGSETLTVGLALCYASLGGVMTAVCFGIQSWALEKRGPVLVAMFSPVGTLCSAILTAVTLGDYISGGSFVGMVLMFGGLYCVLWAKRKEEIMLPLLAENGELQANDADKPLLA